MKPTREQLFLRRDSALSELRSVGNLMRGSLVVVGVRCGAPQCECAKGAKHLKKHLSVRIAGRSRTAYVGEKRAQEVQRLLSEYQRAWSLIEELTKVNLQLLRPEYRRPRADVDQTETEGTKP